MELNKIMLTVGLASTVFLAGCGNDSDYSKTPTVKPTPEVTPPLQVFAPDGLLKAQIRRTTFGVPHIRADNLESLGFGSGYAQAQDNLCVLADGFIKANSERSMYFGPHASIDFTTGLPTTEDNGNLVSDFAYKAMKIRAMAEAQYPQFSYNSRALMDGFSAGYNRFLADIEAGEQTGDPFCSGQPWVKPIDGVDVANYLLSIALLPGAANFLDLIFYANPGDLGSNGWGLGKDKTENGRGMVLGNPHFPHTGNLRFWQSHLTIPGHLDVMGGSLVGMPGTINIGFNKDLAWTHAFSTAEHFVMYNLELVSGDRMQYMYDETPMPITKETVQILVNGGPAGMLIAEKDIYTTPKGPMIEAPVGLAPFPWDDGQAFMPTWRIKIPLTIGLQ
ncbi:aculeacin A acylase [Shewanella benthica KT99]|uniref:Aculeacin A acylase n=1 Tax=Shewanella benthica KT99 TaxID=314608 RepID=A9D0T3_9GAMM|nr:aculeacin A acylase [Shewanella benthica KT99]